MSRKPERYVETRAVVKAKERPLLARTKLGNPKPYFNGSQTNRRNKKRPITLPERA